MLIPDLNETTRLYLEQIHTVSNGIVTFALIQNVTAIYAFFSNKVLAGYVRRAKWWVIYPAIIAGILAYVALIIKNLCLERSILAPYKSASDSLNHIATGIGEAQAAVILVVGIGVVSAARAIRNPEAAGKAGPATAPAPANAE